MATVFWPSRRSEFIELARYSFLSSVSCWTRSMQPSKSVSSARTSEPLASGWTSCAVEILPCGSSTTLVMPAAAQ